MSCQCPQCSDKPNPRYSEEARHMAEVNHVASHDAQWIKKFLEGVQEKRGFDAYKKLRDEVFKVWMNK